VILAAHGQYHVSESKLRLREIAARKVSIFRGEIAAREPFLGEEQTRGAVHQQPGGFVQRNAVSRAMMLTHLDPAVDPINEAMPADEVIVEHGYRSALELAQRERLEFDFNLLLG